MEKKKRIILVFFVLLLLLCSAFAVSCQLNKKEGVNSSTIKLADWENETWEVGYGELYQLPMNVKDKEGNEYPLSAVVKNSKGEKIPLWNGKFVIAEKTDYTVEYYFQHNEQKQQRTVTLKVTGKAKPLIETTATDEILKVGEIYQLKEYSAYDYYEGDLTGSISLNVYDEAKDEVVNSEYGKRNFYCNKER